MSIESHQKALEEIHRTTLDYAQRKPFGEQSPAGYQRLKLRVPEVRKLLKSGYSFLNNSSRKDILETWNFIYNTTPIWEVAHQGLYFYHHKTLNKAEWNTVRRWIDRCDSWEHSDDLSKIYARVFEDEPEWVLPWYEKWNRDKNPWKRRQSIVGLLEYASKRNTVQPFNVLIGFVEPLLDDEDYYVQKGVGWTLREIWNIYPDETLQFVFEHIGRIPPAGYTAATEKLDRRTRSALKKLRAENR